MKIENIIQIAGIMDFAEARMLLDAGVDWLGFPLRLPVHQEDLSDAEAAAVIAALPSPDAAVLITYLSQASEIVALCRMLNVRKVQLHGAVAISELRKLRERTTEALLIKSLVVRGDNLEELQHQVDKYTPYVDAFITDTHDPATGADGATGKTHDWHISAALVKHSPKPVILAGGLTPDNVREAIRTVRPAGVDAHTGVEGADGRKDAQKVKLFVKAAREEFGYKSQ